LARDDRSGVRIPPLRPSEPPLPLARDILPEARQADAMAGPADLARIWHDFIGGRLRVDSTVSDADRHYVFMSIHKTAGEFLNDRETTVLGRVLCGEQQKAVAPELEMACSTASKWYTSALEKLGFRRRPLPLPLVIAAQTRKADRALPVAARCADLFSDDEPRVLLSIPRPAIGRQSLTCAEEEVAAYLAEGDSRWQIAIKRTKSAQTIACQLRGVYSKLQVRGRYDLVRKGVELGWFC
jgi:DNA-binding NarL/FixJ family response regulator